MLKLYNKEHKAIGVLTNLKDYKIEYVLSGEDSLELSLSISDKNIHLVEEEGYVRTKNNEYVIKAIDPSDNLKRFSCNVNIEDLVGKAIAKFDTSNNNITDTIRLAIAGTGWILADNNISKRRTVRLTNTNALEVLREVRKVFRVDFRYDAINKIIYVYEQLGEDRGVYFSDELNLKSFSIPSDTYDYATRLYCYGKDGLNISSVNNGKEYIENFQYSNKVIELIWEDSRYTDVNSLKEDAEAKLDEISKPKRTYQASISDLAKQSDEYKFLDFFLGDTITLLSKQEKFRDKQRIVKYIQYPDNPSQNSCELGNTTLTFEELQKENEAKNNTVDAITSDNGTVDGSKVEALPAENITNLDIEVGKIVDFTSINADITNLKSENVTITGKLNAIEGEFGTIKSNVSIIDQLTVTHSAEINELKGINATFSGELSALSGKFGTIESEVGKIQTLVNGNLSSENIQAGGITSDKLTIANGFITNAMIANLDVSKINAGDISTNKFRIKSDDGGIEIVGATQQFKDKNNKIRIQMGQDTQGNFNFIIRGEDGTTTLIDHTGIKDEAIADDLIKNNMIAQDAVGEKQINYSSFITGFNKDANTSTIKSTKIMLNNQNQTLDVAFNSLKTQADGTKSLTESHSTTIGVMQGQISTAINNTQIVKDGQTVLLKDDYNRTVQTIDSMNSIIGSHTSQISGLNSTVSTQGSSISQLKNQIALKVEQTDINNAINELEISSRNLIKGSKSEYTNISISQWNGTFGRWGRKHCSEYGLQAGDTITFSVKLKPINKSKLRARIDFYSESSGEVGKTTKVSTQIVNKGEEKVSSVTATIPEGVEYITLFVQNVDYTNDTTTTTEQYMHDMLTKGNKVVGWTPAPEDIDSAINTIDGKITSTNNKVSSIETNLSSITQRVSSTEITLSSTTATANNALSKLTLNEQTKMNGIELLPQGYKSNSGVNYKLQYNKTTFSNNSINIIGRDWVSTDFIKIDRTKPLYWKIALTVSSNNLYYFGIERYTADKEVIGNQTNNATIYFKNGTGLSGTFEGIWQETDTTTAYVKLRFLNDWSKTGTGTAKITELSWKQLGGLVIDDLTTEITTANNKVATIETNLSSITSRVSSTETTLATTTSTANSALSKANSAQTTANSANSLANTANNTANANKSSISSLTTRVSTAESKLTKDSLTTTIGSYYTTSTDVNGIVTSKGYVTQSQVQQTVDKLEIKFEESGGENKVLNGQFKNNFDSWNTNLQVQLTFNNPYQLYEGTGLQVNCKEANAGIYQIIETIPGETYSFSMMVNSEINMVVGFEDANCIAHPEANYTWLRYTGTFTATKKQHAIVAYSYHYTGIFYISNVCVVRGSIPPQYTPSASELCDGITTINKNGIEIDSTNANTKNSINHDGFAIINKSTLDVLLKATSEGVIARGGKFVVEDTENGNTVLWGRDIVINNQRALVGTGSNTQDGLISNKLYINYKNDFSNGVEIGGTLTNNGRPMISESGYNGYANSGYLSLSNGFILQWGKIGTAISSGDNVTGLTFSYPIKFPNAVFHCDATIQSVDNNSGGIEYLYDGGVKWYDKNGGHFWAKNRTDNKWGSSMTITWFAIGR